jgi:hypothetical protein
MPIEEPAPAHDTAVVVVHDPLETLGVAIDESVQLGFIAVGEFEFRLRRSCVSASVIDMSGGGREENGADEAYSHEHTVQRSRPLDIGKIKNRRKK